MKKTRKDAFSLIELMVVVTIVGILAMLGTPQFRKSTQRAEAITAANDMGKFVQAVELYGSSNGDYPLNMTYTSMPQEVRDYLPEKWRSGTYSWFYINHPLFVYIYAYNLNLTAEQALSIDKTIDDGDITSGSLRVAPDGSGLWYLFRLDPRFS